MPRRPEIVDDPPVEHVPWADLRADWISRFAQGEHCSLIGPTGSGKTTLAFDLLDGLADVGYSVIVMANKPKDRTLSAMTRTGGWRRIKEWPPPYSARHPHGPGRGGAKIVMWPNYGRASTARTNRPRFVKAFDEALHETGWVIYCDETRYFVEQLGMRWLLDEYWNSARSSDVTLLAGSQGPTWVNRTMTTQESWLFAFRPSHNEEMRDMAKVSGVKSFPDELASLNPKRHEFIVEETRTHVRYISRVVKR